MSNRPWTGACLALVPVTALTSDPVVQVSEIKAEQLAIRSDIERPTGRYAAMPSVKRNRILSEQAALLDLLEGVEDTSQLSPDQRTEAHNRSSLIHAMVTDREDEQIQVRAGQTHRQQSRRARLQIGRADGGRA